MSLQVVQGQPEEVDAIYAIICNGKKLQEEMGTYQWSDANEPKRADISEQISLRNNYVLKINEQIVGTANLSYGSKSAHQTLAFGQWIAAAENYVTIHRFAVDPQFKGRGYANLFLQLLIKIVESQKVTEVRIETHPLNYPMQKVILANHFTFRGIISLPLPTNNTRYAYQLLLKNS